jgi:type IV pilus assembly protein PilB
MPLKRVSAPVLRSATIKDNLQKIEALNLEFKERDIKEQAKQAGLKYIDLKNSPLNQDALQLTTWEQVEAKKAVPFDLAGKTIHIAAVDPKSASFQELKNHYAANGYTLEVYLCSQEGIQSTKHYFENLLTKTEVPVQTTVEEKNFVSKQDLFAGQEEVFANGNGPEMINVLNLQAVQFRASDVHFQPEEKQVTIRLRRDGELYEVLKISLKQYLLLSGEIKRVAGLKINIRNIPQDGNYQFIVNNRQVSVRVSALPSKFGESIVMRLLDTEHAVVGFETLGFIDSSRDLIMKRLTNDRGLILVTGPTGSGKTSTLYSCLNFINTPEKKIITLEDPIEYELKNIIQSEINEQEDYTFAAGLRAILRQDPDVIMVGEIRDKEAGEIALQASLTGHLVLSTIHSNDAIGTIPRLLNMGIKEYILAAGLELVIAQRLVRKICEACKIPAEVDEVTKKEIISVLADLKKRGVVVPQLQFFKGKGCDQCAHTAYQGRVAIAEMLDMTDVIRNAVLSGDSSDALLLKAQEQGFISLMEDGVLKVTQGVTTLEEVWKGLV